MKVKVTWKCEANVTYLWHAILDWTSPLNKPEPLKELVCPLLIFFCLLRIQVKNFEKMRKIDHAALFYDVIFKMAARSQYLKIGTLFINISYMCDPSFIPFSGTRITIMPLQLRLKVIKGHWTLFQGHNIISKSRILILKMIGPSNTCTLVPWDPDDLDLSSWPVKI